MDKKNICLKSDYPLCALTSMLERYVARRGYVLTGRDRSLLSSLLNCPSYLTLSVTVISCTWAQKICPM